ncbi:MAG: Glutamate--tRNA ligase [Polaromonas sp.]|jgi:glutamyl-Q tRNA(Asp) synthetase|nr:Glutamate--tRNA ligase [Polaromonas sp.]MDB5939775.1 Glutamate--tRNA ligase [Polaromonas sp.]
MEASERSAGAEASSQSGPRNRLSRAAGAAAPPGGSEPHVVGSVGATSCSEPREAGSVGATYQGRFAPSPTGPLHAGSLVAALASWLDARAHGGQWLVRIEDVDTPRCVHGADLAILAQLAACGLVPDAPPVYQSQRGTLYQQALDQLMESGRAYPCGCTRQDIARALAASGHARQRHGELVYPGTCRQGLHGHSARAWRLRVDKNERNSAFAQSGHALPAIDFIVNPVINTLDTEVVWDDRRLGRQHQNVSREVGDFVLRRADGLWAYQLAVVVDDAAQGITQVVRGADLADNTARQILLQRALGLPTPQYLHTPLVLGANGEKLSKQNGAQALDTRDPLAALNRAASVLGLAAQTGPVADALAGWVNAWRDTRVCPENAPVPAAVAHHPHQAVP